MVLTYIFFWSLIEDDANDIWDIDKNYEIGSFDVLVMIPMVISSWFILIMDSILDRTGNRPLSFVLFSVLSGLPYWIFIFSISLPFVKWVRRIYSLGIHPKVLNNFTHKKTLSSILSVFFVGGACFAFQSVYYSVFLSPLSQRYGLSLDHVELLFALYSGIIWGGGVGLIKYIVLRLILGLNGYFPWNITHFFDYCTERLILQRVGKRYRFIHPLVQEHFASLEIQKFDKLN